MEQESQALAERMKEDLKGRGVDVANIPVPPDAFKEQAERRVRLGLVVAEIVRTHGLQARPDQIRKQIEEFAQTYENPGEVVRWYFSDRNRLAEVEALVVEQNVVDWVLSKGEVTERALAFDELMGDRRSARPSGVPPSPTRSSGPATAQHRPERDDAHLQQQSG